MGYEFDTIKLDSFASRNARKRGVIKREPVEGYNISKLFLHPYRRVHFIDSEAQVIAQSMIDEILYPYVEDRNEQLLLWRPRYPHVETIDTPEIFNENPEMSGLHEFLINLLESREHLQEESIKLANDLYNVDSPYRSTASLLVPRSPSGIRRHEKLSDEKRITDGWLRAISLVQNMTESDSPVSIEIGERVFVRTCVILFTNEESNNERMLILENPLSHRIEDTELSGRALTRLVSLNSKCFQMLKERGF